MIFAPTACRMISPVKCEDVPVPKDAYEYLSGAARTALANSLTLPMGTFLLASRISGMRATIATGSKLPRAS
ncbi:hypothetical protein D3C72_1199740 [compost metagenome]